MQWEAFFSKIYGYMNRVVSLASTLISVFLGNFAAEAFLKRSRMRSDSDFGEDVHAADLGRHPEF